MTTISTLILPGLGNSGPEHWQSYWERADDSCQRVLQDDWETPVCADWVARLDDAIRATPSPMVLVGHSSSCALVAHWAASAAPETFARVQGALLVAPSDPLGPAYPVGPTGFAPVPLARLPFRTIVVASDDDIYVTLDCAMQYAAAWGSEFVFLSQAGHINAASGFGPWPEGRALLDRLRSAGGTAS
jgi:predicted alpha/beta hydrolase family esterase